MRLSVNQFACCLPFWRGVRSTFVPREGRFGVVSASFAEVDTVNQWPVRDLRANDSLLSRACALPFSAAYRPRWRQVQTPTPIRTAARHRQMRRLWCAWRHLRPLHETPHVCATRPKSRAACPIAGSHHRATIDRGGSRRPCSWTLRPAGPAHRSLCAAELSIADGLRWPCRSRTR